MAKDYWIQRSIKHKGRIKRILGVPEDKPIPASKMGRLRQLAKSKDRSLGSAARLALRFKKGISKE